MYPIHAPPSQNEKAQPPVDTGGCAVTKLAPALGLEADAGVCSILVECTQAAAKVLQFSPLAVLSPDSDRQVDAGVNHVPATSGHDPCVPSAYLDSTLAHVIARWFALSKSEQEQILAIATR